ncbi:MAG: SDR family oxidoreductase [Nitrosomonadaceae bacterium]|jgi:NAD(P)-dependent dehydrogenase (short-subunit alcohol dehydrogenase family)
MKTTLITGANRGIGLEFSRQFAADGWCVLACSRHPEKSDALNKLAAKYPEQITVHALDVADHEQIKRLAQTLANKSIDLLISNAGVYSGPKGCSFGDIDYEAWAYAFLVNTMAPLRMAEAFTPQITRSSKKIIVTITSKMGSVADNSRGGSYIYRSSKSAVNMVVKSLAIDLRSIGIIAVLLHPGWVRTDMGGPSGLISTKQSVSGMRNVICQLVLADSGKFIAYDGQIIPW